MPVGTGGFGPSSAGVAPVSGRSPLRWLLRGLVALGLSVFAFGWAFRGVDLENVVERLSRSEPAVLLAFLGVQLVLHGVRVYRWGLLVRPLGRASWRSVFAAASVGFAATFFLPLRLGEFVRPAMIARSGVPFGGAAASVVVERVADGLFNLGLFFVLLRFVPSSAGADELTGFSTIALALFGGGLLALLGIVAFRKPAYAVIRGTVGRLSEGLGGRLVALLDRFAEGILVLSSPGRVAGFFALTLVYWGANGWVTWLLAESYAPDVPLMAGPFSISVVVFAIMIPAGPAFAGTLEAGFRFGLAPFGVGAELAAVVALGLHALQLLQMALLAGVGLAAAESTERRAARSESLVDTPTD